MGGVSFAAGTLQFAVASQLTTQVAQSMLATMSDAAEAELERGLKLFQRLDATANGTLDFEEVSELLRRARGGRLQAWGIPGVPPHGRSLV